MLVCTYCTSNVSILFLLSFAGLSSFGGLANKLYKSHFPKIVVLNSMLWTLQDMDFANKSSNIDQGDDHGYQFYFVNQTNFMPFAESYVRNITILVSLAKKLYPRAKIFLQLMIPPENQNRRLIGSNTVKIMNNLVTKAANRSGIQVFAFDKFVKNMHISPNETMKENDNWGNDDGYKETVLRKSDGLHPTDIVNRNFVNLLLNIARHLDTDG